MEKIFLFFIPKAYAICPVCTVAVGAGVGLSRWLKIDDTITGIWIGGLIVSLIFWTINWLHGEKIKFWEKVVGKEIIITLFYYASIVLPLYFTDIIGHPKNTFSIASLKIDKLLLGIGMGSIAFFIPAILYPYLKKKNKGRAYFHFQKVAMPILPLIILSIVFYYLTKK